MRFSIPALEYILLTTSFLQVLFELAILRLFSTSAHPDAKCIYMAPTKALCSERAKDWKAKFGRLGWDVIELTGAVPRHGA